MTVWYKEVLDKLIASELFGEVSLVGAKVRASIDETRFLDVHYDPITRSYSYALIDLNLPHPGDKRLLGWDDYPHEGVSELQELESYPHHLQRRTEDGGWVFEASAMRGDVQDEIDAVIAALRDYLRK
jgi:hypothetical protein